MFYMLTSGKQPAVGLARIANSLFMANRQKLCNLCQSTVRPSVVKLAIDPRFFAKEKLLS